MRPSNPKVFISYSHDSPDHLDRVLRLAGRLRSDGMDCELDQYEPWPREGWPRWMERKIRDAEFVLMVCTRTYASRVMGEEEPGRGRGVRWEGHLIYQYFYDNDVLNDRFVPLVFGEEDVRHIPVPFRGYPYFRVDTPEGYAGLVAHLSRPPGRAAPALGPLSPVAARARQQDFLRPWTVPGRNDFFAGRVDVLEALRASFEAAGAGETPRIRAVTGLGGVGKTQAAIEYAYRYRDRYRAVFWLHAADIASIHAGFSVIARALDLPEQNAQEIARTVEAVLRWLDASEDWLLIFDNADQPEILRDFLPRFRRGHVLVTSRSPVLHSVGIGRPLVLDVLTADEARRFLLERTGRGEGPDPERAALAELVQELGCLPLALEQAGAFIAAHQATFSAFLKSYRKRRLRLLDQAAPVAGDYPASVATTWTMNFEQVEETSAAAAELLRVSAFLGSDDVPLSLFTDAAGTLPTSLGAALSGAADDPLLVDEALAPLVRYSLVRRAENEPSYRVHPLVQAVVRDRMEPGERARGLAQAVASLAYGLVGCTETERWPHCDRMVPHVQAVLRHLEALELYSPVAALMLNNAGLYLSDRGRNADAGTLLHAAIQVNEKSDDPEPALLGTSLLNYASVLRDETQYALAERSLQRALALKEAALGPDDPGVAYVLNGFGVLYYEQGRYAEAEAYYARALELRERALGLRSPVLGSSLDNLGVLYKHQGRFQDAKAMLERSLRLREEVLGPEHLDVAYSLVNLGTLNRDAGEHQEAEARFTRSLSIMRRYLGDDHPDVAKVIYNLGSLHHDRSDAAGAESYYREAIATYERSPAPPTSYVVFATDALAHLYDELGRYADAAPLHARVEALAKEIDGGDGFLSAVAAASLAEHHALRNEDALAEQLYRRQLDILTRFAGEEGRQAANAAVELGFFLQGRKRYEEAEPLYQRALRTFLQLHGPAHVDVALCRNNLAALALEQGDAARAGELCRQAVSSACGAGVEGTSLLARNLTRMAGILMARGDLSRAERWSRKAVEVGGHAPGAASGDWKRGMEVRASVLRALGRADEAREAEARIAALPPERTPLTPASRPKAV